MLLYETPVLFKRRAMNVTIVQIHVRAWTAAAHCCAAARLLDGHILRALRSGSVEPRHLFIDCRAAAPVHPGEPADGLLRDTSQVHSATLPHRN